MIHRSFRHHIDRGCIASLLIVLTLGAGCSNQPRAYPASGQVTFSDGSPLMDGRIELRSREKAYSARGAIDRNGKFRLTTFRDADGAIAGPHQVIIVQRFAGQIDNMADHAKHIDTLRQLDPKYRQYETSGLEITIDPRGDNQQLMIQVESVANNTVR